MTQYYLARDVYACTTDDGAVFLSLITGEYCGISAAESKLITKLIQRRSAEQSFGHSDGAKQNIGATKELIKSLIRDGILTHDGRSGKSALTNHAIPHRSLSEETRGDRRRIAKTLAFAKLAWAVTDTAVRLRLFGLRDLVDRLSRIKADGRNRQSSKNKASVEDVVLNFHRLRPLLYSARGQCLFDSLVMVHYMLHHELEPRFAIGVSTRPFEAHAWVEHGDFILNDTVERVQQYTPILAA